LKKRRQIFQDEVELADLAKESDKKMLGALKAEHKSENKELQRKLHQQQKQHNIRHAGPTHHIQQPDKSK
jgi:hypothetical protein